MQPRTPPPWPPGLRLPVCRTVRKLLWLKPPTLIPWSMVFWALVFTGPKAVALTQIKWDSGRGLVILVLGDANFCRSEYPGYWPHSRLPTQACGCCPLPCRWVSSEPSIGAAVPKVLPGPQGTGPPGPVKEEGPLDHPRGTVREGENRYKCHSCSIKKYS